MQPAFKLNTLRLPEISVSPVHSCADEGPQLACPANFVRDKTGPQALPPPGETQDNPVGTAVSFAALPRFVCSRSSPSSFILPGLQALDTSSQPPCWQGVQNDSIYTPCYWLIPQEGLPILVQYVISRSGLHGRPHSWGKKMLFTASTLSSWGRQSALESLKSRKACRCQHIIVLQASSSI